MRKCIATATAIILLAFLAGSIAWSAGAGEVWLGGHLLLRVRSAAGGYTVAQRVDALQLRANNLLQEGKTISAVTVRKSGYDANIYTDDALFMTVTTADAQANGTTPEALANIWAERIRSILPNVTPIKPGVGAPGD